MTPCAPVAALAPGAPTTSVAPLRLHLARRRLRTRILRPPNHPNSAEPGWPIAIQEDPAATACSAWIVRLPSQQWRVGGQRLRQWPALVADDSSYQACTPAGISWDGR